MKTITMEVDVYQKLMIFGAAGRMGSIISKDGYNHLLDIYDKQTDESLEKIKTLHRFVGWMVEFAEQGYQPKKE